MKSDQSMGTPTNFRRGEDLSAVSMKSDQSMGTPDNFRRREDLSAVSMKSDQSMGTPDNFRSREDLSAVSMKSDQSMGTPDNFRRREDLSAVSMKSDQFMGIPDIFRRGEELSAVSIKCDQSMGTPDNFRRREDLSAVSMKCDQFMGIPDIFRRGEELSAVSIKCDQSMGTPDHFRRREELSAVSMKSDQSMGTPDNFRRREDLSAVSMKSDQFMGIPDIFRRGEELSAVSIKCDQSMGTPDNSRRQEELSAVSMKSDQSMGTPGNFRRGEELSAVSMKSDQSMGTPDNFRRREDLSAVSMKSDQFMGIPDIFRRGEELSAVSIKCDQSMGTPDNSRRQEELSAVSMKGDQSMGTPDNFRRGEDLSAVSMKSDQFMGIPDIFRRGEELSAVSMKGDQSMGNPPEFSNGFVPSDPVKDSSRAALLSNTQLNNTGDLEQDSFQTEYDLLYRFMKRHKTSMKNKYESLFEGIKSEENRTLLNRVYTQLYIIQGESEGVNEEHEVLQMEKTPRRQLQNIEINCSDIFKVLQVPKEVKEEEMTEPVRAKRVRTEEITEIKRSRTQELRSVLTKGIAGIGKTVSVQKFILDWAEGAANQDVDLMFVLPFRELNLIKDDQYSLHGLLCNFHPELRDFKRDIFTECTVVFIFDGLDESRVPLNFLQFERVSDVNRKYAVGDLMVNLITGQLLPSAHIWITCRPAAANQIPPQYIHRVTEIQGFTDPQKKEYFRKRIRDQDQAQKIISHIKTERSLHIMCHIPIFCWISATVLQRIITQSHTEIPKTLTEMYSHFLLTQANMKKEKYEEKEERDPKKLLESNRTELLKLAELAFTQLLKGNVMFYEEDLRESSIDVTEASVYSGIFTEIFREECVMHQRKVYCFVHLSFQEFLAAVFVFHCFEKKRMESLQRLNLSYREKSENVALNDLKPFDFRYRVRFENFPLDDLKTFDLSDGWSDSFSDDGGSEKVPLDDLKPFLLRDNGWSENVPLDDLKPFDFSDGRSDCFSDGGSEKVPLEDLKLFDFSYRVRFEKVPLDDLLKAAVDEAIKSQNGHLDLFLRFLLGLTLESNQRLLHGLLTHTHSSSEEMTQYIKVLIKGADDTQHPISTERSINLFLCLSEMKDQSLSREIEGYLNSTNHSGKKLSPGQCSALAYMLLTSGEELDELDLRKYNTSEEGYRRLIQAVTVCRKAPLAGCNITMNLCKALHTALKSRKCHLKELDLSFNNLQYSEIQLLSDGLNNSDYEVEILRLAVCNLGEEACEYLALMLQIPVYSLKELDLCNNDLKDSGVELLSVGLKNPLCELEILRLSGCMVTDEGCSSLASALKSNPYHLRELDLSYNHPGESGVKLLSELRKDPHYRLDKLSVEPGGNYWMKLGLKKYEHELTLDPNTAHTSLVLSKENRKVNCVWRSQKYPDHPDRFDYYNQVLCVESLTGRCYWEVEWSGKVDIAVTYKGITRKGRSKECWLGFNKHSWVLDCSNDTYIIRHNKKGIIIHDTSSSNASTSPNSSPSSTPPPSPTPERPLHHTRFHRVAVYLDWEAGTLSFYTVSPKHALTHLHTVHTTFTEPLYAGFWVADNSSVSVMYE
ncbi:NACHT, LRR and PYD domains-containing protein 3-like [Hoplias malabaricus]|uniref:NACHT, LRR and PYD domains-containing protein 3-like n=1 Tax=Hoplias malabaricus TaxID=27720 RepID=UPI0034625563